MRKMTELIGYFMENMDEFFNPPGFEVLQAPYLEIGKGYRLFERPISSDPVFQEGEESYIGRLSEIDLEGRTLTMEDGLKAVVHEEHDTGLCFRRKRVYEPFEKETIPFSKIYTALEKK